MPEVRCMLPCTLPTVRCMLPTLPEVRCMPAAPSTTFTFARGPLVTLATELERATWLTLGVADSPLVAEVKTPLRVANVWSAKPCVPPLRFAIARIGTCDTWHQGMYGKEGMTRGTKAQGKYGKEDRHRDGVDGEMA